MGVFLRDDVDADVNLNAVARERRSRASSPTLQLSLTAQKTALVVTVEVTYRWYQGRPLRSAAFLDGRLWRRAAMYRK